MSEIVLRETQLKTMTIYDNIQNVFVEDWSTEMNYSKYFLECFPLSCSYRTIDRINWSYSITIFISLYGGLITALRFLSPLLIQILFQLQKYFQRRSISRNENNRSIKFYSNQFLKYIQRMNSFKNSEQRSENEIKRQKIITRVYLSILLCAYKSFRF